MTQIRSRSLEKFATRNKSYVELRKAYFLSLLIPAYLVSASCEAMRIPQRHLGSVYLHAVLLAAEATRFFPGRVSLNIKLGFVKGHW